MDLVTFDHIFYSLFNFCPLLFVLNVYQLFYFSMFIFNFTLFSCLNKFPISVQYLLFYFNFFHPTKQFVCYCLPSYHNTYFMNSSPNYGSEIYAHYIIILPYYHILNFFRSKLAVAIYLSLFVLSSLLYNLL